MQQCHRDAIALIIREGKPDFFLAMTCNPKWLEIVENLLPHQQAADRPDIMARIKRECLLDFIPKKKLYGEVAAYAQVIEFQKRGLPHMLPSCCLLYIYNFNFQELQT